MQTRRITAAAMAVGLWACAPTSSTTLTSVAPTGLDAKPGAAKKPAKPNTIFPGLVTLTAAHWWVQAGGGASVTASTTAAGELLLPFPEHAVGAPGSCCYFVTPHGPRALTTSSGLSASGRIAVTGSPTFYYTAAEPESAACAAPVSARLVIVASAGATVSVYSDRWWAHDAPVTLTAGAWAFDVPMDPARWMQVQGRLGSDPREAGDFAATLQAVNAVGVTFGGRHCNYGHGVYVHGGSATWVTDRYEVR
jgi:hypothetical protein